MHTKTSKPLAFSAAALVALAAPATRLPAAELLLSIGLRETGGSGPAFSNGGASGGIEWVNLDGQTLALDGTWQSFTFTPGLDPLSPFAGATADGMLDTTWAVLEHVRIRNADSIAGPIRIWIDDLTNTDSAGAASEGFESFAPGDEVVFQEPNFSGSTGGNLLPGGTSLVTDSVAASGAQSLEVNFQFVDGDPSRWVRLTTFNTPNVPNPLMHAAEEDGQIAPTISFQARGVVIPEPGSAALVLAAGALGCLTRRRRE